MNGIQSFSQDAHPFQGQRVSSAWRNKGLQDPEVLYLKEERFSSLPSFTSGSPALFQSIGGKECMMGIQYLYSEESMKLFYETGEVCFSGRTKIQTQVSLPQIQRSFL